jgi:hypothetical protein
MDSACHGDTDNLNVMQKSQRYLKNRSGRRGGGRSLPTGKGLGGTGVICADCAVICSLS